MNKTKKECLGVPRPKKSGSDPSGLRFARDRFSAPPAIDVEKIMMAVQDSYLAAGVHMGIKSPLAADLRSRLLSLLSPGKGEGVTVAENKAPRS